MLGLLAPQLGLGGAEPPQVGRRAGPTSPRRTSARARSGASNRASSDRRARRRAAPRAPRAARSADPDRANTRRPGSALRRGARARRARRRARAAAPRARAARPRPSRRRTRARRAAGRSRIPPRVTAGTARREQLLLRHDRAAPGARGSTSTVSEPRPAARARSRRANADRASSATSADARWRSAAATARSIPGSTSSSDSASRSPCSASARAAGGRPSRSARERSSAVSRSSSSRTRSASASRSARTRSSSTRRGRSSSLRSRASSPRRPRAASRRARARCAGGRARRSPPRACRPRRRARPRRGCAPRAAPRAWPRRRAARARPPASARSSLGAPLVDRREIELGEARTQPRELARTASRRARPPMPGARAAAAACAPPASTSRARSTCVATRASFSSARCRRALNLPSPAASSRSTRRSEAFEPRISSTRPWPMIECMPPPRPTSASSSTRSSRRTGVLLTRYWPSPPRWSRRAIATSDHSNGPSPACVVEEQLDLAVLGGLARLRAGEQHVVGLLRAQLVRRQRARGPDDRVGDVRLPGAVRPDDDGDSRLEPDLDGIGERLEAAQLDRTEVHALRRLAARRTAQRCRTLRPVVRASDAGRRERSSRRRDRRPSSSRGLTCARRGVSTCGYRRHRGRSDSAAARTSPAAGTHVEILVRSAPMLDEPREAAARTRPETLAAHPSRRAPGVEPERRERLLSRLLLGGLLRRAAADAELLAVDQRRAREAPLVRRALDLEDLVLHRATVAGERLLQLRLVIDEGRQRVVDPVRERVDDSLLDLLEAVLEEERAERRLEQRREDVAVADEPVELVLGERLRAALVKPPAEIELARDDGTALARDDVRADLRQPPLGEVRMRVVERRARPRARARCRRGTRAARTRASGRAPTTSA